MKEIRLVISKGDYDKILTDIKYKNIEESSYEDSYFDTYMQNFKNKNQELILRNKNLLMYENSNKSCKRKLIYNKKNSSSTSLKTDIVKILGIENFDYSNIANIKVNSKLIRVSDKKVEISLNKISYLNIVKYDILFQYDEEKELEEFKNFLDKNDIVFNTFRGKSRLVEYFIDLKENRKNLNEEDIILRSNTNYSIEDFIVVVEGKSDEIALKSVYSNINIYLTHGLGIRDEQIEKLKIIAEKNNKKILILTDPDAAGEMIRKRILKIIPDAYNKYIYKNSKKNLKHKKQIGVESLDRSEIENIFKNLQKKSPERGEYEMKDLIKLGIYADSKEREKFCQKYNISYGNNKKVLKQLNDYNIKI